MKGLIVVEVKKCLGCHSCEIGCAVEHSQGKDLFSAIQEKPLPRSRVRVESTGSASLPLQCRHCEDPPCAQVCPTGAIGKQGAGDAVLVQQDHCIGCKSCILVCPFGAIDLAEGDKAVLKCDFCLERLAAGEVPACVSSCPSGALQFTSVEQLTREKRREFMVDFLQSSSP